MAERRLYRSRTDRVIWGVCGGLAKYLNMDPAIIRVIAILVALANGIGVVAYIIMTIAIPVEGSEPKGIEETSRENVEEMKQTTTELGREMHSTLSEAGNKTEELNKTRQQTRRFAGIAIIAIGLLILAANFTPFWWASWGRLWPLLIVIAGLLLIFHSRRKNHG